MEDRYLKDMHFTVKTGLSDTIQINLVKVFGYFNSTTIDEEIGETATITTKAIKDAYDHQENSF